MFCRSATRGSNLAGRQGFEPRYHGPEPCVLPLDDLPVPADSREVRTIDYSQSEKFPANARRLVPADSLVASGVSAHVVDVLTVTHPLSAHRIGRRLLA